MLFLKQNKKKSMGRPMHEQMLCSKEGNLDMATEPPRPRRGGVGKSFFVSINTLLLKNKSFYLSF